MTDQYNSRKDWPNDINTPETILILLVFLGGIGISIFGSNAYFDKFEVPRIEERVRLEVQGEFLEEYKDDIWFSKKSKEFKLPPYTTVEVFCEGKGRCGPARPTLVGMVEDEKKKTQELSKYYKHAQVRWDYYEKISDELWKDIQSYVEAGEAGLCLEIEAEGRDMLESCYKAVDQCRNEHKADWITVEWCKENCKIPSKEELDRWADGG